MPKPLSEEEKELRRFTCQACGAEPGKTCRVIRSHPGNVSRKGKPCMSHFSRRQQLKREREGGTWKMVFIPDVLS